MTVITPGGRIGSDAPLGPGDLWHTKGLKLPRYIRIVAHGLLDSGEAHDTSSAVSMAVAAMERWAVGGDHVHPQVQAAAVAALAEWKADQARAHADHAADETTYIDLAGVRHVRDVAYWKMPYGTPLVAHPDLAALKSAKIGQSVLKVGNVKYDKVSNGWKAQSGDGPLLKDEQLASMETAELAVHPSAAPEDLAAAPVGSHLVVSRPAELGHQEDNGVYTKTAGGNWYNETTDKMVAPGHLQTLQTFAGTHMQLSKPGDTGPVDMKEVKLPDMGTTLTGVKYKGEKIGHIDKKADGHYEAHDASGNLLGVAPTRKEAIAKIVQNHAKPAPEPIDMKDVKLPDMGTTLTGVKYKSEKIGHIDKHAEGNYSAHDASGVPVATAATRKEAIQKLIEHHRGAASDSAEAQYEKHKQTLAAQQLAEVKAKQDKAAKDKAAAEAKAAKDTAEHQKKLDEWAKAHPNIEGKPYTPEDFSHVGAHKTSPMNPNSKTSETVWSKVGIPSEAIAAKRATNRDIANLMMERYLNTMDDKQLATTFVDWMKLGKLSGPKKAPTHFYKDAQDGRFTPYYSGSPVSGAILPGTPAYRNAMAHLMADVGIHTWAVSSNDSDPRSLAIQQRAEERFGIPTKEVHQWDSNKAFGAQDYYSRNKTSIDALLDAMYLNTQKKLAASGVAEVAVVRGQKDAPNKNPDGTYKMRPLSSWTTSHDIASKFGAHKLGATVPASKIFSMSGTGFGCRQEFEIVVIGGGAEYEYGI